MTGLALAQGKPTLPSRLTAAPQMGRKWETGTCALLSGETKRNLKKLWVRSDFGQTEGKSWLLMSREYHPVLQLIQTRNDTVPSLWDIPRSTFDFFSRATLYANRKCSVSPYVPANITIHSTYRDFCALPVVYSPLLASSTAALNQLLRGTWTKHIHRVF